MNSKKRLARLLVLGMTLWGTYAGASLAEAADAGMHVDQVGYLTNADKKAMVTDSADTSFTIVDAATQQTVFEGKLSAAKYDALSDEKLRQADFTSLKKAGTYKLKVGNRESYDFVIGDNVYAVPAAEAASRSLPRTAGVPT